MTVSFVSLSLFSLFTEVLGLNRFAVFVLEQKKSTQKTKQKRNSVRFC